MEVTFTPRPEVKVISHSDGVTINETASDSSSVTGAPSLSVSPTLPPDLVALAFMVQWLLQCSYEQAGVIRRQRETIERQKAKIQEQAATIQALRDQLAATTAASHRPATGTRGLLCRAREVCGVLAKRRPVGNLVTPGIAWSRWNSRITSRSTP